MPRVATILTALALAGGLVTPPAHASGSTEPVARAPRQVFPSLGSTAPTASAHAVEELTSWTMQDAGSLGFSHYVLEQYNTYANEWGVVYYGTETSYRALLRVNQFTEFRVTAYDSGGQPGPTVYGQGFVPYMADDHDPAPPYLTSVTYSHAWTRHRSSTAFRHAYRQSTRSGASVAMCGYFYRAALVAPRNRAGGTASVNAFGKHHHAVSFHARRTHYRDVIEHWSTAADHGTPAGSGQQHCLTLTAKSAAPIYLDALEYNVPDIIE
ncbi:MAG: hypothetical protein JO246_09335 [Frankiaceae bacterium]|nr:hypothetical protein [Frankiaceae bacterium]MBV9869483.1 hypothetical protein [Frankiaceae bacterium]